MIESKTFKNIVVFDCETKTPVNRSDWKAMEISVAVSYRYIEDTYDVFLEQDLPTLIQQLRGSDLIVGFNQIGFDMPLLKNYDESFQSKAEQFDLMKEIEKRVGFRVKLDTVLHQTLGTKKSSHGLQAVEWYKQGEISKIIEYCKEDVRQTKMLFDYVIKHGSMAYESSGKKKWVNVIPPDVYKTSKGTNLSLF